VAEAIIEIAELELRRLLEDVDEAIVVLAQRIVWKKLACLHRRAS
jgi:hypothetical protein